MPRAARQRAVLVVLGLFREEDRQALFFGVQPLVLIIRTQVMIVCSYEEKECAGATLLEMFWDVGWIQFLRCVLESSWLVCLRPSRRRTGGWRPGRLYY